MLQYLNDITKLLEDNKRQVDADFIKSKREVGSFLDFTINANVIELTYGFSDYEDGDCSNISITLSEDIINIKGVASYDEEVDINFTDYTLFTEWLNNQI